MRNKSKFAFIVWIVIGFAGCKSKTVNTRQAKGSDAPSDSSNNGTQNPDETSDTVPTTNEQILLEKIELNDSVGIALVSKTESLRLTGEGQGELVSIDAAGNQTPLSILKSGSSSLSAELVPLGKYVYFLLYPDQKVTTSTGDICSNIVLRLTDKRLFCISNVLIRADFQSAAYGSHGIATDGSGDLHFFSGIPKDGSGFVGYPFVYSVDFRQGEPKLRVIFDKAGYTDLRTVNSNGDILFSFYENSSPRKLRIIRPDGGFQPAGSGDYANCGFSGHDSTKDSFHYVESIAGNQSRIVRLQMDAEKIFRRSTVHEDSAQNQPSSGTASFRCVQAIRDGQNAVLIGNGTHEVEGRAMLLVFSLVDLSIERIFVPSMTTATHLFVLANSLVIVGKLSSGESAIVSMNKQSKVFETQYVTNADIANADVSEGEIIAYENPVDQPYGRTKIVRVKGKSTTAVDERTISFVSIQPGT